MGVNDPQVQAMRKAGFTEEEITDMLKCDKEIDRGANLFPLDPELEPGAKKARRADRTDTPKKAERKREPNPDRIRLVEFLKNALENEICLSVTDTDYIGTTVEIVNPEREFLFTYNGTKYKVVLSAPRT